MAQCNLSECPLAQFCDLASHAQDCACYRVNQPNRLRLIRISDLGKIERARKWDKRNPIVPAYKEPDFLAKAREARNEVRRKLCQS